MTNLRFFYIFFVFVLMNAAALFGQSADDYFHLAANFYVKAQNPMAKQTLEEGLAKHPGDAKLSALAEKIKEDEQQQQQQEQQEQNEQEQQDEQDQQQNEEQQDQQQEQEEEQQQPQPAEEQDKDQIDKDEAERILNALQDDEQDSQKKKTPIKGGPKRVGKDW